MPWKLRRTKQCESCPWKVTTNPFRDIPGYDREKHRGLKKTISEGSIDELFDPAKAAMQCHKHTDDDPAHCIGWLMHQLGPGNNIAMRMQMITCTNRDKLKLDGEQHESFEDTIK